MTRSNQRPTSSPVRDQRPVAKPASSAVPRIRLYWQLMRMHKPIGALLLLWPTLWSLWLAADGVPRWDVLIIFVLGVFVMRSAGCVINDFAWLTDRASRSRRTTTSTSPAWISLRSCVRTGRALDAPEPCS